MIPLNFRSKFSKNLNLCILFVVSFVATVLVGVARADVIEFKEEELARESVTPIFDQPEAVKKRYVPLKNRFEFGLFGGVTLNDAFVNVYPVGINLNYHLSDIHALSLTAGMGLVSQTSYVNDIQAQAPKASSIPFSSSPAIKMMILGEYEFTPYYGKISITKQKVMNLTISGEVGAGTLTLTNESSVLASIGFNQRLFFGRNFGLRADLRAMFYQQTDVVPLVPTKRNAVNLLLSAGLVYLIPSL